MTSHLNSHVTTDIKPEMLSGVQTGNGTPHDKYNIGGIAHARQKRRHFHAKTTPIGLSESDIPYVIHLTLDRCRQMDMQKSGHKVESNAIYN